MRAALIIALKDLRQRLRDRSALLMAVVAPFGLAAIFSSLLGGVSQPLKLDYAVVDLDRTQLSAALRDGPLKAIEVAGIATIVPLGSVDDARGAIDRGEVDAVVVVPQGFDAAVTGGQGAELQVIGDIDAGLATDILESLTDSYLAELEGIRLAVAAAIDAGAPLADAPSLAERAAATPSPIRLADVAVETRRMTQATYFSASMAVFFLFFTAQLGALSLLRERREGTLPRLVAAPIPPWGIVLGKSLGSFVLGIGSMAVLVVASQLLLGASWGDPVGVGALVLAITVAAMGLSALVTTFARTEEQASGWNAILAITLAILGGSFFEISQGPELLQRLSVLTPHAWFLDGLNALARPGASVADIALPLVVLLSIGLATGAVGLARARDLVVQR
jgi:ABC-2 type transport system permease protein